MQNKKTYVVWTVVVVVLALATFIGARFLNGGVNPLRGMLPFSKGGGTMSFSIQMTPAPEIPTTRPLSSGIFAERKDNTVVIQSVGTDDFGKGGVVLSTDSGSAEGLELQGGNGPKVEIVVTNQTKIYRDSTELPMPSEVENAVVQQTVEAGTLDDLKSQTMVQVWGRKNGDRIIADILLYSNPVMIKKPGP